MDESSQLSSVELLKDVQFRAFRDGMCSSWFTHYIMRAWTASETYKALDQTSEKVLIDAEQLHDWLYRAFCEGRNGSVSEKVWKRSDTYADFLRVVGTKGESGDE